MPSDKAWKLLLKSTSSFASLLAESYLYWIKNPEIAGLYQYTFGTTQSSTATHSWVHTESHKIHVTQDGHTVIGNTHGTLVDVALDWVGNAHEKCNFWFAQIMYEE